jgi:hypothetical protein
MARSTIPAPRAWTPPAARVEGDRLLKMQKLRQETVEAKKVAAQANVRADVAVQEAQSTEKEVDRLREDIKRLRSDLPKILSTSGGGGGRRTLGKMIESSRPLATQAQAEAGADITSVMTPQRTRQSIDAFVPPIVSDAIDALNLGTAAFADTNDFGDVLSINNLSDLGDIPTARDNLGLGSGSVLAAPDDDNLSNDDEQIALRKNVEANLSRKERLSFKTVADFENNASLTYASGVDAVVAGNVVAADGLRYEALASNAADAHIVTAGSLKSRVLRTSDGAFVAHAFGSVRNSATARKAVEAAAGEGVKRLVFSGDWLVDDPVQTVSAYAVSIGDPAFDVPTPYEIMVSGADGLTIDLTTAKFDTEFSSIFALYRSGNSCVIGGRFRRFGSDADVTINQPSAVLITRSLDCVGRGQDVDGYYRNLFAYRAPGCGFEGFRSVNARYYCAYVASSLDVTLADAPADTWMFLRNGYARGGRYGNYFVDNGEVIGNQSFDCAPAANAARHVATEKGNVRIVDNTLIETDAQNAGSDQINLIAYAPTAIIGTTLKGTSIIAGNRLRGGYKGIFLVGAENVSIQHNDVRDYFMAGVSLISDVSAGVNRDIKRVKLLGNNIGQMNPASTRVAVGDDKPCGLHMEENSGRAFVDVLVAGNTIEAKGASAANPTANVYIEAGDGVIYGENGDADSVANVIPPAVIAKSSLKKTTTYSATGTAAAPFSLPETLARDGCVGLNNSHVALPAAIAGMSISFTAESSQVYVYVNGASSGATGANSLIGAGLTATNRNLRFNGPGQIRLVCVVAGKWILSRDAGTVVTFDP